MASAARYMYWKRDSLRNYRFDTFNERQKLKGNTVRIIRKPLNWRGRKVFKARVHYRFPIHIFSFFTKLLSAPWYYILQGSLCRALYLQAVFGFVMPLLYYMPCYVLG